MLSDIGHVTYGWDWFFDVNSTVMFAIRLTYYGNCQN